MMNVPSCHFFAWAIKKKEWYVIIFQQPVKNNLVPDLHLNYMRANGNFPCPHMNSYLKYSLKLEHYLFWELKL